MSAHADPATHGTVFGEAVVTVDLTLGDCVIRAPRPGPILPVQRRVRFHSVEEIQAAYQVQIGLAQTDPVAGDIARALKFAVQQLQSHQERQS
ncbi:hypothetical protein [Pelagimonas phthalicica]|nr:hypothetical protein [Pelagimonas phthalicica]